MKTKKSANKAMTAVKEPAIKITYSDGSLTHFVTSDKISRKPGTKKPTLQEMLADADRRHAWKENAVKSWEVAVRKFVASNRGMLTSIFAGGGQPILSARWPGDTTKKMHERLDYFWEQQQTKA